MTSKPHGALADQPDVRRVVGRRGQRIGDIAPDIAAAVLVEIDRMGGVGGRDELRVPGGAGPGANERLGCRLPVLQDAQGGDQLVAPERGAACVGDGQRGQRAHHAARAHRRAIGALDAPDGEQDMAVDTVGGFDGGEHRGMLGSLRPAGLDALRRHEVGDVGTGRLVMLGLAGGELDHLGVEHEVRGEAVEQRARDAPRMRGRPQGVELPARVRDDDRGSPRIGQRSGRNGRRCRQQHGHDEPGSHPTIVRQAHFCLAVDRCRTPWPARVP